MARWSIYAEAYGHAVYSEVEVDDDLEQDDVWDLVSDNILMTLEVTKEED